MKVKTILICLILIFTVSFSLNSVVLAQENESTPSPTPVDYALPYPGILPDHPLYFLKVIRDKILEFVTGDPIKKANLDLLLSDKHLVMGGLLWEKGSLDLSTITFEKGEKYLLGASAEVVKLKNEDKLPPGLADKIELAGKKHEEVIDNLIENLVDDDKKDELEKALGITHQATQQILSVK